MHLPSILPPQVAQQIRSAQQKAALSGISPHLRFWGDCGSKGCWRWSDLATVLDTAVHSVYMPVLYVLLKAVLASRQAF